MALKLYGVPLSPFARMAHAVAELTNNEVEYVKERLSSVPEVFHFALSNEIALTRSEFSSVRSNPPPLAPKNYESNDF